MPTILIHFKWKKKNTQKEPIIKSFIRAQQEGEIESQKWKQQTVRFMNLIPDVHFLGKSETPTLSLISQISISLIHLYKHANF